MESVSMVGTGSTEPGAHVEASAKVDSSAQGLQTTKPEPAGSGLLFVEFESDKLGGEGGIRTLAGTFAPLTI